MLRQVMSKGTLLWLFAHGAIVWQASLALVVIVALGVAARRALRAAAKNAAVARARLGEPLSASAQLRDGAAVTLAGRLEAPEVQGEKEAAAVMAVVYRAEMDAEWEQMAQARAEQLVLVVGEERIAVAGTVEVVLGAREMRYRRRTGRVADALARELEPWEHRMARLAVRLRSVAHGDDVWASGVLRREAVEGSGAYRDRPIRWRLVAASAAPDGEARSEDGARRVEIAFARVPSPHALRLVLSSVLGAAAAGLVALAVFGLGGEIAHRRLNASTSPTGSMDEAVNAASILAVTPFHRAEALGSLASVLEGWHDEVPAALELLAALREAGDGCGEAATLWIEHGQLERGAAQAEACGADETAARAWYVAGDFARASRALERARAAPERPEPLVQGYGGEKESRRFGVLIHLLAGRPDLAATEARALAAVIWGPSYHKDHPHFDERAGIARCLADAIDARRGDMAARARLEREPPGVAYPMCGVLLADLLDGRERLAAIDARKTITDDVPAHWLALLAAEADPEAREAPATAVLDDPGQVAANPLSALRRTLPAVERGLAEALARFAPPSDAVLRSRAHTASVSAVVASVAAHHDVARRFAAEALDAVEALGRSARPADLDPGRIAELDAVLALAEGDGARFAERLRAAGEWRPVSPFLEAVDEARETGDPWWIVETADVLGLSHASPSQEIELLGISGDGERLGRAIRKALPRYLSSWNDSMEQARALRVLSPSMDRGREDLLRWIRWGRKKLALQCGLLCQLIFWMDLSRAAEMLGDDALAAELRGRGDRFYQGLFRRDLAVPLAVLDAL